MDKECYEEEVQPYRKMDYKPIIYIYNSNYNYSITITYFHMFFCLLLTGQTSHMKHFVI